MAETLKNTDCGALVIGGSAGSLNVLLEIFPNLNTNLNFPIIIVLHRKPDNNSLLTNLLQNRTKLLVSEAEEKERLMPAHIYIAPADYHLLIEKDETFSLDYSEKINYSRPSIDVTFQSAADIYKENLVCMLLSGSNSDGVEGLKVVKRLFGRVIIQNPKTANMPFMPQQALLNVKIDYNLDTSEMASFINNLSIC